MNRPSHSWTKRIFAPLLLVFLLGAAGYALWEAGKGAAARVRTRERESLATRAEAAALRLQLEFGQQLESLANEGGAFLFEGGVWVKPAEPVVLKPLGDEVEGDVEGSFYLSRGTHATLAGDLLAAQGFFRSAARSERPRATRARAEYGLSVVARRLEDPAAAALHGRRALARFDATESRSREGLLLRWTLSERRDPARVADTLALLGGPDAVLARGWLRAANPGTQRAAQERAAALAVKAQVIETIDLSRRRAVVPFEAGLLAWTRTGDAIHADLWPWPARSNDVEFGPPSTKASRWLEEARSLDAPAEAVTIHVRTGQDEVQRRALREAILAAAGLALLLGALGLAAFIGQRSARRARESERTTAALLAHLGHELRTPVASIRMFGETLASGRAEGAEATEFAQTIADESERLTALLDKTLDVGRARASEEERELLDLTHLLQDVLKTCEPLLQQDGWTASFDASGPAPVFGAAASLRGLAFTLIENALQHGAGAKRLDLRVRVADGEVRATVSDDGPGFPAGLGEQAFDRFVRGPSARGRGVGLGLALARETARSHDGELTMTSSELGGAALCLVLPLEKPLPA